MCEFCSYSDEGIYSNNYIYGEDATTDIWIYRDRLMVEEFDVIRTTRELVSCGIKDTKINYCPMCGRKL